MNLRFRNIVIGYVCVWIVAIVVISVLVWFGLARFQENYETQKLLQTENKATAKDKDNIKEEDRVAPESITLSFEDTPKRSESLEIIAYSNMRIKVDGKPAVYEVKENLENQLLSDYSELTGNEITQCVYLVSADSYSSITVENSSGGTVNPVGHDYTAGIYKDDENLSKIAIALFEQYLMHVSKMISMEELQESMRSKSVAYKAVRDSQESLKWMIAAKEMEFPKEETKNMMMLDDGHMICDVYIDLHKVTENNRTVNESVKYRVLYEQVNGKWYIYSFEIIV